MENALTENPSGTLARLRRLNIGPRLTACFLIIVVLIGAVDLDLLQIGPKARSTLSASMY
jgi:hypothetical protein